MKKQFRKGMVLLSFLASCYTTNAQLVATMLSFENPVASEHEYGFSTVEYNGYSIFGTEFNQTVNVHRNNVHLFRAVSPNNDNYASSNGFGHAVGMNQDWVAIGAYREDVTPNNQSSFNEGKVYLSKNMNGAPQNNFNVSVTPQTPVHGDQFGEALDMDGQWMVVGAPGSGYNSLATGYVEIWKQNGTGWERKHRFQPANLPAGARFGFSVAIKGDYIVIGAPKAKKIYVYKNTNSVWSLLGEYTPNMSTWAGSRNYDPYTQSYNSNFGHDVDVYGTTILVGDPGTVQKAAILTISGTQITLSKTLLPPGHSDITFTHYGDYGHSVALELNRAVVAAPITYGPDITDKQDQGKVFFYGNSNYQSLGYMNVGNPAGKYIRGLGRSVSMHGEYVLVGAEYTDNLVTGRGSEGAVFRMPFYYIGETGNTPPTVSITSPDMYSGFNTPANVTIQAHAADADGTVTAVEFYKGSTLVATDYTAPYSHTLTNVPAGNHYVYVKAIDNQGGVMYSDVIFDVINSTSITGPACVSRNQTVQFELAAAKRVNATGFNWYFSGSVQNLAPVSGAAYKVNLSSGNYFTGGQLCVGVNYSVAPYHATYCLDVASCPALKSGEAEEEAVSASTLSFPNPFNTETTLYIRDGKAGIEVMDATGASVLNTEASGSYTFGAGLKPGIYFVKIKTDSKTEVIKVIKE